MRERHDTRAPSVSLLRRMARFDDLPADQKAVLQLVLRQGRTYGEIAGLLKISTEAVRDRALTALDAVGPTGLPDLDDAGVWARGAALGCRQVVFVPDAAGWLESKLRRWVGAAESHWYIPPSCT